MKRLCFCLLMMNFSKGKITLPNGLQLINSEFFICFMISTCWQGIAYYLGMAFYLKMKCHSKLHGGFSELMILYGSLQKLYLSLKTCLPLSTFVCSEQPISNLNFIFLNIYMAFLMNLALHETETIIVVLWIKTKEKE